MCGRTALYTPWEMPKRFKVAKQEYSNLQQELLPRFNAAPTSILPTIVQQQGVNHIKIMRWGFMPRWAKNPNDTFKYSTFNAKSEGIFNKPMWQGAILQQRCLVPANGFYEWRDTENGKIPFFIRPKGQEMFAFAGIYNTWKDAEGYKWNTYAILTTTPNDQIESIHKRMPVILKPVDEARWLDPTLNNPEDLIDMLKPYDNGGLEIIEVSREVNNARNDHNGLIQPINPE